MQQGEGAARVLREDLRRGGYAALAVIGVATIVAIARTQLRHRPARRRDEWRKVR